MYRLQIGTLHGFVYHPYAGVTLVSVSFQVLVYILLKQTIPLAQVNKTDRNKSRLEVRNPANYTFHSQEKLLVQ